MKVDIALIEELAKFNEEGISKRRLCEKGIGVVGDFTLYMSMKEYTAAKLFQNTDHITPVYFRFSRFTEMKSNADSLRDLRGLGCRFLYDHGNYDMLCGSSPVFFVNDVKKLPQLLDCLKPTLARDLTNYEVFWRFIAENPESTFALLWLFSGKGTVKSYRFMDFYSVHTYLWINEKGQRFYVRYHWSPIEKSKTISRHESEFLAGFDPNVAIRDLTESIENEEKIVFELNVQILASDKLTRLDFDPLDVTLVWKSDLVENYKIGKFVAKRVESPDEESKIHINPRNLIEGIGLSQGKMLQAMCMGISDSQRQRLGIVYREPESFSHKGRMWSEQEDAHSELYNRCSGNWRRDYYSCARDFYMRLNDNERNEIIENILDSIMFVQESIQEKVVDHLTKVDEELGAVLSMGLDF